MDFNYLRKLEKIYPIIIDKYESFIPNIEEQHIVAKMNSVIQYLNNMGKLTNEVVTQWNTVMKWVLDEGLTETTSLKIDSLISSGQFDNLLNDLFSEFIQEAGDSVNSINDLLTQYETKYANLEQEYATELTNVNVQLAQTTQLIQNIQIDVKSFGAKGDGATDDTQAIQNARNALTLGSTLYFPAGVYIYEGTPLEFKNNEQITLKGTPESFVKFKNMDKGIILGDGVTNKTGVRFDTIGFIGESCNYGIYADNYSSLKATLLKLTNFTVSGIYIKNGWLSKFSKCDFRGNGIGIDLQVSANGVTVDDCYFINNTTGIKILGGSGITISKGSMEYQQNGIVVDKGILRSLKVKNMYFEANTNGGVILNNKDGASTTYWKGINIQDNYFTCIDVAYGIVINTLNTDGTNNPNIPIEGTIKNNSFATTGGTIYKAGIMLKGNRVYIKSEDNYAFNMNTGASVTLHEESGSNSQIRSSSFSSEIIAKGSIELTSSTATGIILTSPNGTRYKLTVSDAGSILGTPI